MYSKQPQNGQQPQNNQTKNSQANQNLFNNSNQQAQDLFQKIPQPPQPNLASNIPTKNLYSNAEVAYMRDQQQLLGNNLPIQNFGPGFQLPQNTPQFMGNQSQIQLPNSLIAKNVFQQQQYHTPTPIQQYKFDDDEPLIRNKIEQNNLVGQEATIQLSVDPLYKKGCLIENQSQSLPACITVRAEENKNPNKQSVDLFCVVDKSGSMMGEKIQNCQNSLLLLLEYLTPQDRLCLIQFDQLGKRLTPLKTVTDANKHYFRNVIQSINAQGNDVISNGLEVALQQIRERKYQNDVTSIFLLSDGQDGTARVQVPIQLNQLDFPITLHTFGFGQDHDPQLLTFLASLRNGNFYFINRLDLLAEFFVDALGAIVSTVATNVEIQLKCQENQVLQQMSIRKLYGKQWKMKQKDLEYEIQLEQISSGTKKDFVFEIFIPKCSQKIVDETIIQIGIVTMKYKQIHTNKIIEQQQNLELVIVEDIKNLNINQRNLNVAQQLARVQTIELIEQAAQLCQQNQNEQAQDLLAQQLKRLQQQFEMKDIQNIYQDLEEAIKSCQRQVYQQYGQQQMCNISYNSSNQKGITTLFVNGIQQMPQQQGVYQNQTQYAMMQQMQQKR